MGLQSGSRTESLRSGTTLAGILELTRKIRRTSAIPIVLLAYYNTIQVGARLLCTGVCRRRVDGLVVPDLPPEEAGGVRAEASKRGITVVQMLAPTSTPERMHMVSTLATGFIYCVSLTGVTGARPGLSDTLTTFLQRVRHLTETPLMVGFGISTPEQAVQAARTADGVIVGSALIDRVARAITLGGTAQGVTEAECFVRSLLQSLDNAA